MRKNNRRIVFNGQSNFFGPVHLSLDWSKKHNCGVYSFFELKIDPSAPDGGPLPGDAPKETSGVEASCLGAGKDHIGDLEQVRALSSPLCGGNGGPESPGHTAGEWQG